MSWGDNMVLGLAAMFEIYMLFRLAPVGDES